MRDSSTNTLFVNHSHLLSFDGPLAQTVGDEFVRFEPFMKLALQEYINDRHNDFLYEGREMRDFYVAFFNMPAHIK